MVILRIAMLLTAVAAAIGIIQKNKGSTWGAPLAIAGACLTILLGIISVTLPPPPEGEAYINALEQYRSVCGTVLGQHLAEHADETKVTIVSAPGMNKIARQAFIDAFSAAADDKFTIDSREVRIPQQADPEEERELTVQDVQRFLKKEHNGSGILVLDVGIPYANSSGAFVLRASKKTRFAVTDARRGMCRKAIRSGLILAAICWNPDRTASGDFADVPTDPQAAFDKQFLLLTRNNINESL